MYYQRGKKHSYFQNKKAQEEDKKGRNYLTYLKELVRELTKKLLRERVLKNFQVPYQCKTL